MANKVKNAQHQQSLGKCRLKPFEWLKFKRLTITNIWWGCGKKWNHPTLIMGMQNGTTNLEDKIGLTES